MMVKGDDGASRRAWNECRRLREDRQCLGFPVRGVDEDDAISHFNGAAVMCSATRSAGEPRARSATADDPRCARRLHMSARRIAGHRLRSSRTPTHCAAETASSADS